MLRYIGVALTTDHTLHDICSKLLHTISIAQWLVEPCSQAPLYLVFQLFVAAYREIGQAPACFAGADTGAGADAVRTYEVSAGIKGPFEVSAEESALAAVTDFLNVHRTL